MNLVVRDFRLPNLGTCQCQLAHRHCISIGKVDVEILPIASKGTRRARRLAVFSHGPFGMNNCRPKRTPRFAIQRENALAPGRFITSRQVNAIADDNR